MYFLNLLQKIKSIFDKDRQKLMKLGLDTEIIELEPLSEEIYKSLQKFSKNYELTLKICEEYLKNCKQKFGGNLFPGQPYYWWQGYK